MANARKYKDKAEYEKAMGVKRADWNKRHYKRLSVSLSHELYEKLEDVVERTGTAKRQIIISLLENHLDDF